MENRQLAGKVALITGGSKGIGVGIARRLAALGTSTIICGRTISRLEQTAQEITAQGGRCRAMECDVRDWGSVSSLARDVEQALGRLDILVNNAGVGGFGAPLHTLQLDQWDTILNTNLRAVFYTMKAFVPLLIKSGGGHVINISSIAGKNPLPNGAAYAASKWGLNGLSYSLAEELRSHNIRVSVICPGSTQTELSPHQGKNPQKMLQPDDIAHVVAMLVTQSGQSFASEVILRPTQKP